MSSLLLAFNISNWSFLDPYFFWLLLLVPFLIFQYFFSRYNKSAITVSNFIKNHPKSVKNYFFHIIFFLRIFCIVCLIFVLARPQTSDGFKKIKKDGIDIILAIDVSTSMEAKDFKPNRLETAKKISIDFIERRLNDRVGLVVYAGESFTQCPLTTDYKVLKNLMKKIKTEMIKDGTAIGLGLGTSVKRLMDSSSKSKIIILLTDGVNTVGDIDPVFAATLAKENNIKVYTIGIGTDGFAPYPQKDVFGRTIMVDIPVEIDEDLLKLISKKTGGKYFRANNEKKLEQIYSDIEKMEKNTVKEDFFVVVNEEYLIFGYLALLTLVLEILFSYTIFRKLF